MTFCIGIRVKNGLVALADTQIVRGDEMSSKAKLSTFPLGTRSAFIMTSGLRSVRDKTVMRLEDTLSTRSPPPTRVHQFATAFGDQLRAVRTEDGPSLESSGLRFNLHAIVGGQFENDPSPVLFQIYPEGNWVDATPDSPYFVIGRSSYGKPILDRLLRHDTPLTQAIALAFLAFDATRASVVDVDFPIDLLVQDGTTGRIHQRRFEAAELASTHDWWHGRLKAALEQLPMQWVEPLWERQAAPAPAKNATPAPAPSSTAPQQAPR